MSNLCKNTVVINGLSGGRGTTTMSFLSAHFLCVRHVPNYQKVIDSLVEMGFVPDRKEPQYSFYHKESGISLDFGTTDLVKMDKAIEFYDLVDDNDQNSYNYDKRQHEIFKTVILGTLNGQDFKFGTWDIEDLFPSLQKPEVENIIAKF